MTVYSLTQIQKEIKNLVEINLTSLEKIEFIVGISRGGLIPATLIATQLNKPLVVAYIDPQDNVYFDRGDWIKDRHILIVDDICRSGKTMNRIKMLLMDYTKEIDTLTVFKLPNSLHMPSYSFKSIEDIKFPWD